MAVKYTCGGCGLSLTVESELPSPVCPKCRASLVGEMVEASTVKVARPVMTASNSRGTGSFTSGISTTSTKELSSMKSALASREAEIEKLRQQLSSLQAVADTAVSRLEEETQLRTETAAHLKVQEQTTTDLHNRLAELEKLKDELEARLQKPPPPALPVEIDAAVRQSQAEVAALRLLLEDAKASVATQERAFQTKMETKEAEVAALRQRVGSGVVNLANTSNSDDREMAGRKAELAAQAKQRAWTMIQNGTVTVVVFVFTLFLVLMRPAINGSVLFLAWLILIVDVVAMAMFIRELKQSYDKGKLAVSKIRDRQAAQIASVTSAASPASASNVATSKEAAPEPETPTKTRIKPDNQKMAALQEAMKRRQQGKK